MTVAGLLPVASIVRENAPLQTAEWWFYLQTYLQEAGAFALAALWVWIIAAFARAFAPTGRSSRRGVPLVLLATALLALTLFAVGGISSMIYAYSRVREMQAAGGSPADFEAEMSRKWFNQLLNIGGLLALLGVLVPFGLDLARLRWRRVWALTRLTFLEAIRRRVLWGFLVILALFLFPPKWFLLIKPEDEVRINVNLVHAGANLVLLLAAAALASFSLPTDIRNQTIHTIVTKPVEKFEIVLGRFLGYLGLLTAVLLVVFGFALLMLSSSRISPEARQESMKARVPVYGELGFQGPSANFRGESVGREWEYRRYVPGGPNNPHRAVWFFTDFDRGLATKEWVDCEFSFDIFRTTKGVENEAVKCTFFVVTHQANRDAETIRKAAAEFEERLGKTRLLLIASPTGDEAQRRAWEQVEQVSSELGYYEYRGKPVADYHTDSIPVPRGIFAKSLESNPESRNDPKRGAVPGPRVMVAVRCDSPTQLIGVAQPDLYLLAREGNFFLNFFKGALGIWMRLFVVVGIAVACSTYLNGVVTFLATGVLTVLGFFKTPIVLMTFLIAAEGPQPGPADSLRKLVSNESLGAVPDVTNPTVQVASGADNVFRWGMRRVISAFPDMERWTWSDHVADGFQVPNEELFWSFLGVLAYLSLWAVLAHYLIKWREIATW